MVLSRTNIFCASVTHRCGWTSATCGSGWTGRQRTTRRRTQWATPRGASRTAGCATRTCRRAGSVRMSVIMLLQYQLLFLGDGGCASRTRRYAGGDATAALLQHCIIIACRFSWMAAAPQGPPPAETQCIKLLHHIMLCAFQMQTTAAPPGHADAATVCPTHFAGRRKAISVTTLSDLCVSKRDLQAAAKSDCRHPVCCVQCYIYRLLIEYASLFGNTTSLGGDGPNGAVPAPPPSELEVNVAEPIRR